MTKGDTLTDPRKQYKQGKIPPQKQDEPGLDRQLQPLADHGEASYKGSEKLIGRKALITGGDSGIGRAVAIAFAREGADVVISYLPAEQGDADDVLDELAKTGRTVAAIPADLTDEASARQLVHEAAEALGGLDIVVNNAGKQIFCDDITKLSSLQLQQTFTVNIFAMFWIVQEAMNYLQPGASIINTTSIQATQPSPGLLDYASTKGAITTFTRGLAQQLTPKGIRVNAVAPGPIWTPLQPSYGQSTEKLVKFGEDTPLARPGQPAELAGAYVYLASDDASFVSGEVIGVTGGKLR
ncbi:MAG: SDR family oxidoreductase [Candidatus Saccharimonas sp.]